MHLSQIEVPDLLISNYLYIYSSYRTSKLQRLFQAIPILILHFIGVFLTQMTWADLSFINCMSWVLRYVPDALDKYPRLSNLKNKVESSTRIAQYLRTRPETSYWTLPALIRQLMILASCQTRSHRRPWMKWTVNRQWTVNAWKLYTVVVRKRQFIKTFARRHSPLLLGDSTTV